MRKNNSDALKYTANIVGVSAVMYFAASYFLRFLFSLLILLYNKNASLQSPIGVPEWVMGCANLVVSQGSLLLAILVIHILCIKGNVPKIELKAPKSKGVWFFLPVFLGFGILTNIINALCAYICKALFNFKPSAAAILPSGGVALFLYFLALCAAPAILEEIFVRGYIQGLFMHWGPWFGILASSALFTLLHADITQMPGIFLLSVMLGATAYTTSSLLPGIVLHFANNCVAFLLALSQQNSDSATLRAFSAYIIIMLVVAAVLCAGVIYKGRFYRGYKPIPRIKDPKNRQSRFERLLTSPCYIIVMLALTARAVIGLFY